MIDTQSEQILTLAQAAASLPRRRRGRKVHTSCLYRWSTTGCRGVVLETIQVGGTRCTSREALQRFFEALTRSRSDPTGAAHQPRARTESRRRRDSEAAARELERMGA